MASAAAKRLAGKTVLITGASSGIGRSTAQEFARTSPNDLRLILTARRVDELEQLAKEIADEVGAGVKVLPVKLDISDPAAVRTFVHAEGFLQKLDNFCESPSEATLDYLQATVRSDPCTYAR